MQSYTDIMVDMVVCTGQDMVVCTGHGMVVCTGHGMVVCTGHGMVVCTGHGMVVCGNAYNQNSQLPYEVDEQYKESRR